VARIEQGLGGGLRATSVVERLAELYAPPKKSRSFRVGRMGFGGGRSGGRRARRRRRSAFAEQVRYGGPGRWAVAGIILGVLLVTALVVVVRTTWITVQTDGVADGDVIRGDQVSRLAFRIKAGGPAADSVMVMFNGKEVETEADPDGFLVAPLTMATPGDNRINYRINSKYPWARDKTGQIAFSVRFGPSLSVPRTVPPPTSRRATLVRGLADDDVIVTVNGKPASRESGMFQAYVPFGARDATVIATAPDGAVTKAVVKFDSTPVKADPIQAFHLSLPAWRYPNLDKTLVRLSREKKINAAVLTIKDEYGVIGYKTGVPLANQIGAVGKDWRVKEGELTFGFYEPRQAIDRLHELGLRAIGRIICFLDPQLAEWALKNDQRNMLVQNANGEPIRTAYGTAVFTNFADERVRQYLIQLAVEAAKLGFDDIMFDYVRRPEGKMENLLFPGLTTSPAVAVANFVREARQALPPNVKLGLAVFGVSASRPFLVGQDIRLLAPLVDYIAPMVYPSHWVEGEYKVQSPIAEPGKIVERSTAEFVRQASTGGAYTIPWIQDFDAMGYKYGVDEVGAQINASYKGNGSGFFLWNSKIEYHLEALPVVGTYQPDDAEQPPLTTVKKK
jgi:hypothetical protein